MHVNILTPVTLTFNSDPFNPASFVVFWQLLLLEMFWMGTATFEYFEEKSALLAKCQLQRCNHRNLDIAMSACIEFVNILKLQRVQCRLVCCRATVIMTTETQRWQFCDVIVNAHICISIAESRC